ncbi:Na+/melibiose symporter [Nocardioides scoriae]|uniref:Na+/melibiose symporter n=1 Tax=Nocardioides scoriae TaxID=642780 RepID=A0A1H1WI39_9ACTN|nr:MFS transporter [Nocardioides scoriae]SDS96261.1 Na+/melibiose symporter [Nocardioides scoriae]
MSATRPAPTTSPVVPGLVAVVGFLVAVEVASGILQGYYTPVFSDIARHLGIRDADVNWFEAAQLVVSALVVPLLARLGDLWGHRQVLLLSTGVTALASWGVALAPGFTTFLVAWALQGFYVVWLPLEVAIIYRRTAGSGAQGRLTRRSAALLVAALELGVIAGALTSGALVTSMGVPLLLTLPAVAVSICFVVVGIGVAPTPPVATGRVDLRGFALVTLSIGLVMAGLILVRLQGPGSPLPWLVLVLGLASLWPFVRVQLRTPDPLIDVRLLATPAQWPVQLTAFLFGMSVLGAQIPLSTFARTDPAVTGYGLGASASFVSTLIGVYVVALVAGALSLPLTSRLLGTRGAMLVACLLVALGYGLFLPLHGSTAQTLLNMAIAGVGSGALVAALPAAAAAAAPPDRTGFVTGMTNTTKTIGGAIASSVFAIALAATGSIEGAEVGAAPLSGYLTVWAVCSATALVAAACLLVVPRDAFAD